MMVVSIIFAIYEITIGSEDFIKQAAATKCEQELGNKILQNFQKVRLFSR